MPFVDPQAVSPYKTLTYIPVTNVVSGGGNYSGAPGIVSINWDPMLAANRKFLEAVPDNTLILQYASADTATCIVTCATKVYMKGCSVCTNGEYDMTLYSIPLTVVTLPY